MICFSISLILNSFYHVVLSDKMVSFNVLFQEGRTWASTARRLSNTYCWSASDDVDVLASSLCKLYSLHEFR